MSNEERRITRQGGHRTEQEHDDNHESDEIVDIDIDPPNDDETIDAGGNEIHEDQEPEGDTRHPYAFLEDSSSTTSVPRIRSNFTDRADIDGHLEKLLECPVCFDVMLPPILSCEQGHNCCSTCRVNLVTCPVCRGKFTRVRNLFAEQFLENCQFSCKYGCNVCLPAPALSEHYEVSCDFRPIMCRECDVLVPYGDYLSHVERQDKLEKQRASECSTGFEIDEADLTALIGRDDGTLRYTVWEPTWMSCYGHNYFCNLDYNGHQWWIWVSGLEAASLKSKCQIILWSKEQKAEHTYFGDVHSIRSDPVDVLRTGNCLILTNQSLKNFMFQGGIDVLVRIELQYNSPKTRRGHDVQSPLELVNPTRPRRYGLRSQQHHNNQNVSPVIENSPSYRARGSRSGNSSARSARNSESRIPISVQSPSTPNSSRTQSSRSRRHAQGQGDVLHEVEELANSSASGISSGHRAALPRMSPTIRRLFESFDQNQRTRAGRRMDRIQATGTSRWAVENDNSQQRMTTDSAEE